MIHCFGCSHTYGTGLGDTFYQPETPSMFSWPALLEEKTKIKTINHGIPGASNKEIWNKILNTKFSNDDLIIVQWTTVDRSCIITKNEITKIGSWKNENSSNAYFRYLHDKHDSILDLYLRSNHILAFLKNKLIQILPTKKYVLDLDWNSVDFKPVYVFDIGSKYPKALDNLHPNKDAQKEYAEKIYGLGL